MQNKTNTKCKIGCHQLTIHGPATINPSLLFIVLMQQENFLMCVPFQGVKAKQSGAEFFFLYATIRVKQNPTESGIWLYSINSG